jgi:heme/copper-type cytochrome/quinol oxidase subunit 4
VLIQLDRTGLSHWLLGFGACLILTIIAIIMLIVGRNPDPDMYRNSIAFTAISSFF